MVDAAHDQHGSCVPPNVNPLIQQVVMTAYIAMLGVPLTKVVWSWLFVPCYLFLDWRYSHGRQPGGSAAFDSRHRPAAALHSGEASQPRMLRHSGWQQRSG